MFRQSGFGLIEVLVAGVLLGIVGLGLSRVLDTTFRGVRAVQSKSDVESLVQSIKLVLQNEPTCAASLRNSSGTTASFDPTASLAANLLLHQMVQGTQLIAKVGQDFQTFKISSLTLLEVDASARSTIGANTRYMARLRLQVERTGKAFTTADLVREIPMWVTTNTASKNIVGCGTSSLGGSDLAYGDLVLTKLFVAVGCDTLAGGECYCGGLETVHRATPTNPTGSPYDHTNNPFGNERPRAWSGTVTCPAGHVLGAVGADCRVANGKLENVIPTSTSSAFISCCAYTSDSIANGTVIANAITAVCYKL